MRPTTPCHRIASPHRLWLLPLLTLLALAPASLAQDAAEGPIPLPGDEIDFSYPEHTSTLQMYRDWGERAGVNILFDPKIRDLKMSVALTRTTYADVLRFLTKSSGHFVTVLDDHSLLISDDTPQNRRVYERQVIRAFPLENIDIKDAMTMVRSLIGAKNVAAQERANILMLRDTAVKVAVAAEILRRIDQPRAEVTVETEILHLGHKALERVAAEIRSGRSEGAGALPQRLAAAELERLRRAGHTIAHPALALLDSAAGELNLVDVIDLDPRLDEGLYLEVGFALDVAARIHPASDEVTLTVEIALHDARPADETTGPVTSLRELTSSARLAAGETLIVQGLLPVGGKGSYLSERFLPGGEPGEIVFALTPRIVRKPVWEPGDLEGIDVGTEAYIEMESP